MCLSHSAPSTDPPRPETVPPAAPRNGPLGLPPLAQYTVPFAGFLFFLVLADWVPLNPYWDAPLRVILLGLLCWLCWPRDQKLAPNRWMQSTIVGIAVFLLWIAPEVLIPGWRMLPPFHNSVVGAVHSSLPGDALRSPWVLTWRTARAALIVPVVEELFGRSSLMRWLIG